MKSSEIREKFLQFFKEEGHIIIPSSSLVPFEDPELLFTNSGMVQFKDVFLGKEARSYTRAASLQKSIRAGGKHNDLENVGYTTRHHTFFEMLGNFSFGDYFKEEAIDYAWRLLTEVYKLPSTNLLISVYEADNESYEIWKSKIGISSDRLIRIGDRYSKYDSDNFWQMSDVGPCGPCSEIFYDRGPTFSGDIPSLSGKVGERYVEIWNLVFMQFDRDHSGEMKDIPKPCVDTGMGLERIASVLQNVRSNYETDLFRNLIVAAARETRTKDLSNNSLKVIADHIRSSSFLITDGVLPTNEGRGYVLRRIIRRALMHGNKLGKKNPFFHKLVPDLAQEMGGIYPKLNNIESISAILLNEEERFCETLNKGLKILKSNLNSIKPGEKLDGKKIFSLYDTYGFPMDLTSDICREFSIKMDIEGFESSMNYQRNRGRSASLTARAQSTKKIHYHGTKTCFLGYETLQIKETKILGIFSSDHTKIELTEAIVNQRVIIILDKTPFYPQSGGQIGDTGWFWNSLVSFIVLDTHEIQPGVIGHYGLLEKGTLQSGQLVTATVNKKRRISIQRNHSATHLLHKALRQVLGDQIQQCGSLVSDEKIRFDFSKNAPMTLNEITKVELIVNNEILENNPVNIRTITYKEAVESGSIALFTEKYENLVRVVNMGFSSELCGGTHVLRTGDIGFFKIILEESVGFGVRRIEGLTGEAMLSWIQNQNFLIQNIENKARRKLDDVPKYIVNMQDYIKNLNRNLRKMQEQLAFDIAVKLKNTVNSITVKGTNLVVSSVLNSNTELLRAIVNNLRKELKNSTVVVVCFSKENLNLAVGVTNDLLHSINANDLIQFLMHKVGGKGGGLSHFAIGNYNGSAPKFSLENIRNFSCEWIAASIKSD